MSLLLLKFPNFNLYSTPLLILVLQGLIFGVLLLLRYGRKKNISDLILAFILIITCYHRTTYTIGFMEWYDTFPNTKINYYLISLELLFAPLIYFYVKSITTSDFKLNKNDFWHFIPWLLFFSIKLFIFIYDASQPGFNDSQNGYMVMNFQWNIIDPVFTIISHGQMLLYLAFTFQLFYQYRDKIQHYFSNTYKLELNWIRNFLYIYTFIFLYGFIQIFINEYITELSWTQKWWLQFCSAMAVIYIGIKGYFTDTIKLTSLNFESKEKLHLTKKITTNVKEVLLDIEDKKEQLRKYFEKEKPFLNPDLNLTELAKQINMNRAELSEIINTGFDLNFNDFINGFRVEAIKQKLHQGEHKQLSLLGIAYDCGFNSKATFN